MGGMPSVWGWRRNVGKAVMALPLVTVAVVPSARAACLPPPAAIVWSSPAQGETNVPTNADLWLLITAWSGPSRVLRGGVELPQSSLRYGYDLGELAPNTQYRLQIEASEYDDVLDTFVPKTLELSFTTGAGGLQADPGAEPGAMRLAIGASDLLSPACNAAVAAQDCFDAGQDTFFVMHPSGAARGWLIERASGENRLFDLWPGECGAPRLYSSSSDPPCVRLHGLDAAGSVHPGVWSCFPAVGDAGVAPADGVDEASFAPGEPPGRRDGAIDTVRSAEGCTVSGIGRQPSAASFALLALALGAVARTRAARRSASLGGRRENGERREGGNAPVPRVRSRP